MLPLRNILGKCIGAGTIVIFVLAGISLLTAQTRNGEPRGGIAIPGLGIESILIGASTLDNVVSDYGDDFSTILHKRYSIEYEYKGLGLAFYACAADPQRRIFNIEITPPYRATTPEGAVLGKSVKNDVTTLYADINGIDLEYDSNDVLVMMDIYSEEGLTQCDEYGILPEVNEQ